jgi:hypothetical protein
MKYERLDPVEYFWSHVEKRGPDDCWHWTGAYFSSGYGYFSCVAVGNPMNAHRGGWKVLRGDPGKLMVLHSCDDRGCCNPDHWFLGTGKDNMKDCSRKGRIDRGKKRYNAVLDDDIVREIRKLRQRGATYPEIMKRFDVGKSQVSGIVRGTRWAHVA